MLIGADCSVATEPVAELAPNWNLVQVSLLRNWRNHQVPLKCILCQSGFSSQTLAKFLTLLTVSSSKLHGTLDSHKSAEKNESQKMEN